MSEEDDLCGACGCPEPRQDSSREFCPDHEREIQIFERWLAGTDKVRWPTAPSFDRERRSLTVRQRPA